MESFYEHIKNQFGLLDYKINVHDDEINLMDNQNQTVYKERLFNYNSDFTTLEVNDLIAKSNDINHKFSPDFGYFKCWYMLTHEKYFCKKIELDKYGRIGSSNLRPEFHEILKIPIADVLKITLQDLIGVSQSQNTKVYFTCDFDHLNIWDVWNFKDFAKAIYHSFKELNAKKMYETTMSYILSRRIKRFNYFLNEEMFCYAPNVKNIGFFITSDKNGFDEHFDYTNKLIQNYIDELKKKNVVLGLHTSFYTQDNPDSIHDQSNQFISIFQQKSYLNRHHYLRFRFPSYLNTLEKIGIKEDYSIYFPENLLFRCGSSSSFTPWNECEDRPFQIKLFPITLMDGTFTDYLHCSFKEAKDLSLQKIDLCFQYSSDLVLLWHNRSTYKNSNIKNNYHPELISFLKNEICKRLKSN